MTDPVAADEERSGATPPARTQRLFGQVIRPPEMAWDGERYVGAELESIDPQAIERMPGLVSVVHRNHWVAVLAVSPAHAAGAARRLPIRWRPASPTSAAGGSANSLRRHYRWPASQPAAQITVLGWYRGDRLWIGYEPGVDTAWTEAPRIDASWLDELAALTGLPRDSIQLNGFAMRGSDRHDTPGALRDAIADVAWLSLHAHRPVQITAVLTDDPIRLRLDAALSADGALEHLALHDDWASSERPSLATLLSGNSWRDRPAGSMRPPYRTSSFRHGAQPLGSTITPLEFDTARVFALESFVDELARQRGEDPVAFRLARLDDLRGMALIRQVAQQARQVDVADGARGNENGSNDASSAFGRGFAFAHWRDESSQPVRAVWSAWMADVRVDSSTGQVSLQRVVVGHDGGPDFPEAMRPAIEAELRNTVSRWVGDPSGTAVDSSARSALVPPGSRAGPQFELLADSPRRTLDATISWKPLEWSRVAALPAAAALANAIHQATGIRLREPPFGTVNPRGARPAPEADRLPSTDSGPAPRSDPFPGQLSGQLPGLPPGQQQPLRPARRAARSAMLLGVAALAGWLASASGWLAALSPWRAAIAEQSGIDLSIYSPAALERGARVAAVGDCAGCHTVDGGAVNAGGRALETPFGIVYSTNITPDRATGIGAWSFAAFERAMRDGISRDGHHLYPAFPYTAFARLTDDDLRSLYAWLMSQPATHSSTPATRLVAPLDWRGLMAGWNLLFHRERDVRPDPTRSPSWNRGAYLVKAAGHCGACHSPRNTLGAERSGSNNDLAGGWVDGWQAPALNHLSAAPLRWTEDDLFDYLRTGRSDRHGSAAGPMAPVIRSLSGAPDEDIRAMATYLASLSPPMPSVSSEPPVPQAAATSRQHFAAAVETPSALASRAQGAALYAGACAVCHTPGETSTLPRDNPPLALNTNLHADRPDNLIQVILDGIPQPMPSHGSPAAMPGFRASLDDGQIAALVDYLRAREAPARAPWENVLERVRSLRRSHDPAPGQ